MSFRRITLGLALAPFAFAACISSHSGEPSLEVGAAIASVTLADDCPTESAAELVAGDCAEDSICSGFCTQTGIRLTLTAGATGESVPFEVVAVRLTTMEGELLDELDPHAAQIFTEGEYGSWDEMIHAGDDLHVTYDTSAPDWTTIGGGDSWRSHGMSFRIEMVVLIDGIQRTLEFSPASREAEIVT